METRDWRLGAVSYERGAKAPLRSEFLKRFKEEFPQKHRMRPQGSNLKANAMSDLKGPQVRPQSERRKQPHYSFTSTAK
jgi:hypothetical protein